MADPGWFDDELEAPPRRRRRLVLVLGLVAAAWIALALGLLRGSGGSAAPSDVSHDAVASPRTDEAPHAGHDDTEDHGPAPGSTGAPAASDPAPAPPEHDGTVTVSREEAEALALAVVRGWLSDGGPDLAVPGIEIDRRAYLEHAVVESLDLPNDDLAVARVLLVLLVREDDRYIEATVRRAAVPLTVTPTSVHPGGAPWWLPSVPDLSPVPPTTEAAPDLAEEVLAALTAAGYRDATVAEVAVTGAGTIVAEVTATTPAGDAVDGPVWLAPTADGPVVLGGPHPAPSPPGPPPARPDDADEPEG